MRLLFCGSIGAAVCTLACGGGANWERPPPETASDDFALPGDVGTKEIATPAPKDLSLKELAHLAKSSLVVVRANGGLGTGFSVSKRGWVVTNLHVIEGADQVQVQDPNEQVHNVTAVRAFDRANDLAILEAPTLALPALPIATTIPETGEAVVAVGHPQGLTATVSNGIVSAVREFPSGVAALQFTAPISPGSSGGPLLNNKGHVVGVVVALLKESQNVNFAATSAALARMATQPRLPMPLSRFAELTAPNQAAPDPTPAQSRPVAHAEARPSFPQAVGGFVFGSTLADASSACSERREYETIQWLRSTQEQAECPFLPIDIPFGEAPLTMWFTAGRLGTVVLTAKSFDEVRVSLVSKYGKPDALRSFNPRTKSWSEAARWKKGDPGGVFWNLSGGTVAVLSLDGTTVFVHYRAAFAAAMESESY